MKQEIRDELNDMGSSLAGAKIAMPYSVPAGYFEAFAAEMVKVTSETEETAISAIPGPLLPYKVPSGYFGRLPANILEKATANRKKTALISFSQLRWAAAAVLFIAVGIGAYNMMPAINEPSSKGSLLAAIGDNDIRAYLAYTSDGKPNEVLNDNFLDNVEIDNKDIIAYLDQTGWEIN